MLGIFGRTLKTGEYAFVSSNKRGKVFVHPNSRDAKYAILRPPLILSVSESSDVYLFGFKWKGEKRGALREFGSGFLKEGLKMVENAAFSEERRILEEKDYYQKIIA